MCGIFAYINHLVEMDRRYVSRPWSTVMHVKNTVVTTVRVLQWTADNEKETLTLSRSERLPPAQALCRDRARL